MHIDNQARPYLVSGGYPQKDLWVFFTPEGIVEISGCNKVLFSLLPLCNGQHSLEHIFSKLEQSDTQGVVGLLDLLFEKKVICDVNHIFEVFYAYSSNPMPFASGMTQDEMRALIVDTSHISAINGPTFSLALKNSGLQKLLDGRVSTRQFSGESMNEEGILNFLWSMYGKQTNSKRNSWGLAYNVPSGGALYPLFVYLALFRKCGSLLPGIYSWHKESSLLELLSQGNYLPEFSDIVFGVPSLDKAVGIVCVAADFNRSAKKYGNKAYNLVHMEVGHLMQNAHLYCVENDIGMVEVGGYYDRDMASCIGLDFPSVAPLIVSVFGSK